MQAVAALPERSQEALLDAIQHSVYNQPPTDWSEVTNLGLMRAVPEVRGDHESRHAIHAEGL